MHRNLSRDVFWMIALAFILLRLFGIRPWDQSVDAYAYWSTRSGDPYADMIARAGHDLVHRRFCVELMVHAIEATYDDGARAVRLSEVAAG